MITTAEDLLSFIKDSIPNFTNPEIEENDIAFHYTSHWKEIEANGRFLGAPINEDLDNTQITISSPQATNDPGVVFAYKTLESAKEEGMGCDVVQIKYTKAIITNHSQENAFDDFTNKLISELDGDKEYIKEDGLKTVLILNTDITSFEKCK